MHKGIEQLNRTTTKLQPDDRFGVEEENHEYHE